MSHTLFWTLPIGDGVSADLGALIDFLPSQWKNKPDMEALINAFDAYAFTFDAEIEAAQLDMKIETATFDGLARWLKLFNANWLASSVLQPDITIEDMGLLGIDGCKRVLKAYSAAHRCMGDVEGIINIWTAATGDLPGPPDFSLTNTGPAEMTAQMPTVVNAFFITLMQTLIIKTGAALGMTIDINFTPLP